MDPTLVGLDNLERQLSNRSVTVSAACKRIEALVNGAAGEEACRYFYQMMPSLLKLTLGHNQQAYSAT